MSLSLYVIQETWQKYEIVLDHFFAVAHQFYDYLM